MYTFKDGLKDKLNYVFPFTYAGLLLLYIVILTLYPSSDSAAIDPKTLSTVVAFAGVVGAFAEIGVVIDASGFKAGLYFSIALSLSLFIGSFLLPETGNKSASVSEAGKKSVTAK
ncbi:hypothetical protein [Numidum massiliense]|uniref:hypothetical protein n=1 Tax=Numidum massiliense TaxID=1522315 RepID=UPI0006D592C1|nr:hypothetical protein [Numidum massiliense]